MSTTPRSDLDDLPLDPIWRQAAKDAVCAFRYGDIIPHPWLFAHLHIADPVGKVTREEHHRLAFDLLTKVDGFKDEMLRCHQRYLVNIRGVGYKIIEPPHQTSAAMIRLQKDLRKAISGAMSAVVNINETALSLEDARVNADARAKLGAFASLHIKKLSVDAPGTAED